MLRIALILLLVPVAPLWALHLDGGLSDYQVVQCDEAGVASLDLSGRAEGDGTIVVSVHNGVHAVIEEAVIATVSSGAWEGRLEDLPAGGPYRVTLSRHVAGETVAVHTVHQVLAGDVWILAGQSNMYGVGNLDRAEPPHGLVHAFRMSYAWHPAREPLHILAESPDPVHFDPAGEDRRAERLRNAYGGTKGAGLGLAFAREMVAHTGRPVGLICAAHGGTSMAQWDPALKDEAGASLYGSMYRQVQAAGGKVRGVLWYQGESDANDGAEPVYREAMERLVAALRSDFDAPELPFYYVQIGRFVVKDRPAGFWNRIQGHQLALEDALAPGGLVASIDLGLDDLIHIDSAGLQTLGRRLSLLAARDLYGGETRRGPRIAGLTAEETPQGRRIVVDFEEVNGGLRAEGRPSGFSVSEGAEGAEVPVVFKVELLDENRVAVWVHQFPEDAHLWYGRGLDPYANITDDAGLALPVCGPFAVPVP